MSRYPRGCEDWLAATYCDAWFYAGGLENYPRLVDRMAGIRPLWGVRGVALRHVRSPWRLGRLLRQYGLHFPETQCATASSARIGELDDRHLYKPLKSCGGANISRAAPVDDGRRYVRQAFCAGESHSAIFVSNGRRVELVGVTRQLIGESWTCASPFQYCGSIGPVTLPPATTDVVQRVGEAVGIGMQVYGWFGLDFVLHGEQMCTIEVNPRYTASIEVLERSFNASILQMHVDACTSGEFSSAPSGEDAPVLGKAIVYAPGRCEIESITFDELWQMRVSTEVCGGPRVADIPRCGDRFTAGAPLLTLFSAASHYNEARQILQNDVAKIYEILKASSPGAA
ncbi:MAG: ATP-grasp domain-containing protein [Planctomycetales bacterium]|nr:ATP-grasp domain-containing protein [Planctomycetales bacterium]